MHGIVVNHLYVVIAQVTYLCRLQHHFAVATTTEPLAMRLHWLTLKCLTEHAPKRQHAISYHDL